MFPRAVYNLGGLPVKYFSNFDKMLYSFQRSYTCFKTSEALKGSTKYRRNFIRYTSHHTILKPRRVYTKSDEDEMMQYFPDIVKDLTTIPGYSELSQTMNKFSDFFESNVPNGSKVFGCSGLLAYKMIEKPEKLTTENLKLATILAWCIELHGASLLITDDMVDNSETRRNAPCWYKLPDVGLSAINDANMLSQTPLFLLMKYFSTHKNYVFMMEKMNQCFMNVFLGQVLDVSNVKLEDITMERYRLVETYKSGLYSFLLPVTLSMYMTDVYSENLYKECENILIEIGRFFARENDMWDIFADPSRTGKIGSDIQEGKSTWIAVTVLQKANASQRKLMEEYFGKPEKESVEIVRNLFEELDIPKEFFAYRDESYKKLQKEIEVVSHEGMRNFLYTLAEKFYRRRYD